MTEKRPISNNVRVAFIVGIVVVLGSIILAAVLWKGSRTPASSAPESDTTITKAVVPVDSYADVVARVAPAVVTIRSERRVRAPQQHPFFNNPFFDDFFGGRQQQEPPERVERGLGSGVIVTADGYVLTNHHVIDGAEQIRVEMADNRVFDAKVVGTDPPSDLAVLKIDASGLPVLVPGDSDRVRVGDVVMALGNPLGVGQTVTAGIISAKGRATGLSDGSFEDFLQTDAPINRGNSGGALVNTNGELIGINSQIVSPSGGNIGIGFAIPSNMARNVMDQLISTGDVRRGQLGVTIQPVTSDIASSLGLKESRGVLVNSVTPGGPAERAGIHRGDVILAINGEPVHDTNSLRNRVASTKPGSEVTLTILRDGSEQQVRVTLGELSSRTGGATGRGEGGGATGGKLGISAQPLTPEIAARLGLEANTEGLVVVAVEQGSPAAEAGIQQGDVIAEANRQPVKTTADLEEAINRSGDRPVLLLIIRQGRTVFVPVRLRR
jgi:serine protease Do